MTIKGRVLIIAGSDPSGGAGIQADIKTCTALGAYAMSAITALTAQNTTGVYGVHEVPEAFIAEQMRLCLTDIGADALKTGMLHKASVIDVVAATIKTFAPGVPLVLDPVMVAKGGAPLLKPDAIQTLIHTLIPLAALLTPNLPEAELLSGITIKTEADMLKAAEVILRMGANAVLVKGGHMEGEEITDILVTSKSKPLFFNNKKVSSRHTHGTGCTLASAIASGIAQHMPLEAAVARARDYVRKAIETASGLGKGHGPLNHCHTL